GDDGSVLVKRFAGNGRKKAESSGFDHIRFLPKANGPEMWNALRQDQLDLIYECPYSVIHETSTDSEFVRRTCPSLSVNMLHFNTGSGPFADWSLRNLVAEAIDKEELFKKGNECLGCIADGPISPASSFYPGNRKMTSHRFKSSKVAAHGPVGEGI